VEELGEGIYVRRDEYYYEEISLPDEDEEINGQSATLPSGFAILQDQSLIY
jgi:hypothetical protein